MIQLPWRRIAAVLLPLALAAYAPAAEAQVNDSLRLRDRQQATDTVPADSVRAARRRARAIADTAGGLRRYRISPRTAFLRSLVLPGWGQSSIGAPGRGAVYFALESGSLWMVYKSGQKLQEAKELERVRHADGTLDPERTLPLVRARRNEREDWITLSVFWLFFSGADAYVAAHLRDFDEHVDVQPTAQGGTELRVNVPLGELMGAPAPIGIFDSGIGGLSVAREIRRELPSEHLLYLADSAWVPYGDRTVSEVRARTLAAGRYLQERGAKVLVVACNTASGAALELLREHLAIPVVGLEPAVKPAVAASVNGRVGVMATVGTLRSDRYARLVEAYSNGSSVIAQPCPGLADLIEDGHLDDDELRARLAEFAAPLREAGVDTVVLGCTHYPFVRGQIEAALGPGVRLLDSGPAIARQTARVLRERGELEPGGAGSLRLFTTGDAAEVAAVATRIWGEPLPAEHLDVVHAPAGAE